MYIVLLKVYCSSFSAVAAGTFNWPMIDRLRNKDQSPEQTPPAFKCDQEKRKRNMGGTAWKFAMESIVHSMWKLQYDFADVRINCFALLISDVVKNSICIVSFLSVLQTLLFLSIIHFALIRHSLAQIWSTPFR